MTTETPQNYFQYLEDSWKVIENICSNPNKWRVLQKNGISQIWAIAYIKSVIEKLSGLLDFLNKTKFIKILLVSLLSQKVFKNLVPKEKDFSFFRPIKWISHKSMWRSVGTFLLCIFFTFQIKCDKQELFVRLLNV